MGPNKRILTYIVKDTKTYMNIEEARFKYADSDDRNILFVIIPKNIKNNMKRRVAETLTKEFWDEIIWIDSWSNGISSEQKIKKRRNRVYSFLHNLREYFYNYMDRKKLDSVASKYAPCELVISAHKNTQEHLAWALNPSELIIVDSGHRIFKRINRDGYIDYSRWFMAHSRFTRTMYRATGLKVFDRDKTTLFTVYADEIETNHKVEKNNFDHQSHVLNSKELGDQVVWISTPIYAMTEGVRIEDYVSYIQDYVDHLNIDPGKLIYIPHPGKQRNNEIAFIRKKLNCQVDDRDIPLEYKLAKYDKLPKACISPFSSALVNVHTASGGRIQVISAWHYEFNYFEIWRNWRKDVEKNPKLNIEFIELDSCSPLFYIKNENPGKEPIFGNFKDWRVNVLKKEGNEPEESRRL